MTVSKSVVLDCHNNYKVVLDGVTISTFSRGLTSCEDDVAKNKAATLSKMINMALDTR